MKFHCKEYLKRRQKAAGAEGRRKKEEGRRKKEEGRGKKEEGRLNNK
ncbi:MAG: hypothetical protein F6K39_08830 [Okeania sp. SIO3B3]|nr:hypothetical protein [Okeania sp. SIO3B3]